MGNAGETSERCGRVCIGFPDSILSGTELDHVQKKRYKKREKPVAEASSATEALAMVIQEKKLSNKINYKVLDNLKASYTSSSSSLAGGTTDNTGAPSALSASAKSIFKPEPALNRSFVTTSCV